MSNEILDWRIECDRATFEKAKLDPKFPLIVALARAENALHFVNAAMLHAGEDDAPENSRDRLNSFFFASAIMYEAIKLIRAMARPFKGDDLFKKGLLTILRDPVAQKIEQDHLNPARNHAVFHFLPETFADTINSATVDTCTFIMCRGELKKNLHYSYADVVTAEILVGFAADTEAFYDVLGKAMAGTRDLVTRFTNYADHLIAQRTKDWGFKLLQGLSTPPATGS